ncbi:MAG: ABC transporter ATP-binding protein [Halobacteriota archaeon]
MTRETAENMLMVEAQKVHKVYEADRIRVHALRDVNLLIEKGDMVAVIGQSGCGKTTLLNCLSGLDEVTSGTVKIEGIPLSQMNDNELSEYRATRMGFVFQSFNLLPVLTAEENVELPLLVAGVHEKKARLRAREMLASVDLEGRGDHKPAELSGGQQQRVAIARALINRPAIIWADEPTGNLDSDGARQIMELLRRLNRMNKQTFVIVTHDPSVAKASDRLIRMRDGVLLSETFVHPS